MTSSGGEETGAETETVRRRLSRMSAVADWSAVGTGRCVIRQRPVTRVSSSAASTLATLASSLASVSPPPISLAVSALPPPPSSLYRRPHRRAVSTVHTIALLAAVRRSATLTAGSDAPGRSHCHWSHMPTGESATIKGAPAPSDLERRGGDGPPRYRHYRGESQ